MKKWGPNRHTPWPSLNNNIYNKKQMTQRGPCPIAQNVRSCRCHPNISLKQVAALRNQLVAPTKYSYEARLL